MIDPGDAAPVLKALEDLGLQLQAILVTHHHSDHVGGVQTLQTATGAPVYGPALETMPTGTLPVRGGEQIQALGLSFQVLDVPGHTAGHVAYYSPVPAQAPLLFCGDTLFSGGCGRLFEGTPAQMLASLDALAALPETTRICCAHEYTLSNLKFARVVEPDNAALAQYQQQCEVLRAQQQPTLPSHIGLERQINPFLRARVPAVAAAAQAQAPSCSVNPDDAVAVLATLREWKNNF